ncbi:MAG: cob(I)yrinic acid a,c-diamide adenosyltransferase [Spirochaetia bacterium]|jgi:cob(I)alamin adenosyltransferase
MDLAEVAQMNANVGSGDRGMTSLLSGERVPKSHARVEACGEVDELSSVLGAAASTLPAGQEDRRREIQRIQGELLHVGARLATSPGAQTLAMLREIGPAETRALEQAIEAMEKTLPPLQSFILPGGHPSAAWAHVARTVCRRAERRILALAAPRDGEADAGIAGILGYMNRLSTYLFVLARACNAALGVPEVPWKG